MINFWVLYLFESRFKKISFMVIFFCVQAGGQYYFLISKMKARCQVESARCFFLKQTAKELEDIVNLKIEILKKINNIEKVSQKSGKNNYAALVRQIKKSGLRMVDVNTFSCDHLIQFSVEGTFQNFYNLISTSHQMFPVVIVSFLIKTNHLQQNLFIITKWMVM